MPNSKKITSEVNRQEYGAFKQGKDGANEYVTGLNPCS